MADEALRDFLERMGPDYRARYHDEQAALHLRMAREATPQRPVRVRVSEAEKGRLDVTFVGLDFFAEFAFLCGALAARGLDIESGQVFTSAPPPPPRPSPRPRGARRSPAHSGALSSRTIVDEFRVIPRGEAVDQETAELERRLEGDVRELLGLLAHGQAEKARDLLDRRLAERFSRSAPPASALAPMEVRFDHGADSRFTAMEVRGPDTPGFLYALATALAVRNVYVQQVEIACVGDEARDLFLVSTRDGKRIEDPRQLAQLRAAVALIKQFTHLLPYAPDPAIALRSFGQLVDRMLSEPGEKTLQLLGSPEGLRELARVLGASTFLWEDFLRLQSDHLLPVLDSWKVRPLRDRAALRRDLEARLVACPTFEEKKRALNALKDEEMLLADMRHLLDPQVDLGTFSRAITDLAEAVVEAALGACSARVAESRGWPRDESGRAGAVAALGLGKFGGGEMGYASDIELVFVYESPGRTETTNEDAGIFFEEVVRELVAFIEARQEGIFHVDLRLRPHGAKGPLASPLSAVREYYGPGGGAAPFERQALIKLRRVAGDPVLGEQVEAVRDAFVWSAEPWDRENALHLRERQCRELVPPGRFNVKYSPGALVEVEYSVQYLQLEHGRESPRLRTPSTLEGLDRLREAGLLDEGEREALREAYHFWRAVADGLRMVRGNARDLLLPEEGTDEIRFLARRLGYAGPDWGEAARAFLADLDRHRDQVGRFFTARFNR